MSDFSTVTFTIRECRAARLFANGTYQTTSVSLDLASKLMFKVIADNDMIKAYGAGAELLSVVTHLEGTLGQASVDPDGMWVLTGENTISSDTTPNRVADTEFHAGGSGLPYVGVVGRFAATLGGSVWLGLRKMMLDTLPGWEVDDQNKFRLAETDFHAVVNNLTDRKLHKLRRLETDAACPVDFNTFFS